MCQQSTIEYLIRPFSLSKFDISDFAKKEKKKMLVFDRVSCKEVVFNPFEKRKGKKNA